ncbi:DUF6151 family protein [Agaribacterium sp. ZY112]|uniref:DUF6151 family protein n=1 Tax=Agaribacterium sp. ZY112 TaxID=3233574 RepID=UPI00352441F4
MSNTVKLECSCSKVKGELKVVQSSSFHVHCLCCDCQSYAAYLGNQDKILDDSGGSELLQTYPAYMAITEGQEYLACTQFREKGIYRWHTSCCNMPVANTMRSASVPFIGVSVKLMQFSSEKEKLETLGPVLMKAFAKYAIGIVPEDAHLRFPLSFMPRIIWFMLKGLLGKKHTPSPFFKGKRASVEVVKAFD